jgi:hypothetical protein
MAVYRQFFVADRTGKKLYCLSFFPWFSYSCAGIFGHHLANAAGHAENRVRE